MHVPPSSTPLGPGAGGSHRVVGSVRAGCRDRAPSAGTLGSQALMLLCPLEVRPHTPGDGGHQAVMFLVGRLKQLHPHKHAHGVLRTHPAPRKSIPVPKPSWALSPRPPKQGEASECEPMGGLVSDRRRLCSWEPLPEGSEGLHPGAKLHAPQPPTPECKSQHLEQLCGHPHLPGQLAGRRAGQLHFLELCPSLLMNNWGPGPRQQSTPPMSGGTGHLGGVLGKGAEVNSADRHK